MSAASQTLAIAPLEHLAMDYARLRTEGVRMLGELASEQWTDFNSHDPGITILEQLCYAITDLAYRIDFPVPDLLAGPGFDARASMPSAATILGSDPVTLDDLRKLALDASGADNAWIEPAPELACPVYHHAGSGALHLDPDPAAVEARAVSVAGVQQVWLPTGGSNSAAGREACFARLHARRSLGEDVQIALLSTQAIHVDAAIEIAASDQPDRVLASVVAVIDGYLSPTVGFEDLAAARDHTPTVEALFTGPQLERGFIPAQALAANERRRIVYASDLLHAIADVPGVRAVRELTIAKGEAGPREQWMVEVDDGRIPTLHPSSRIRLLRDGRPLPRGLSVRDALARLHLHEPSPLLEPDERDLPVPSGRDRQLGRYHSILDQLPQIYGVGRFGLPRSASDRRKAQARQLRAYLLIFDQLLANMFAQLAHARELFSPLDDDPNTYWSQVVDDPVIELDALRVGTRASHAAALEGMTLSTATDELGSLDRRSRFLSHLLARYAEQLDERGAPNRGSTSATEQTRDFIRRKLAVLRAYPELSAARGRGVDLTTTAGRSGLAERIRLELGLADEVRDVFVVEHLLLRPIAEDHNQRSENGEAPVPLLAGVSRPDPWSNQISVVCRDRSGELDDDDLDAYERLVEQLVGEHCPAHLSVTVVWLGDEDQGTEGDWSRFVATYDQLRASLASYRVRRATVGSVEVLDQLRFRDARDRMIELLGIGETFPLRDIPLPGSLVVRANTPAVIELVYSQPGVVYQLCDPRSGQPILADAQPVTVVGTGGPLELITPPILDDVDYKLRAIRTDPAQPERRRVAWLHTTITIREGVDPQLDAKIRAPLLDQSIDNAQSSDARLISYGDAVEVEILLSQEGVHYELVDHANPDTVLSTADVLGTGAAIVLQSVVFHEDVDLRIRGRKALDDADPDAREALLDLILPLRVLANPNIEVVAAASVTSYAEEARIRVRGSQVGVRYTVHTRPIRDDEYLFEDPPATASVEVDVGDAHRVRIRRPEWTERWNKDAWPQRDSIRTGNGNTLSLAVGDLQADVLALARGVKTHQLGPLDAESSAATYTTAVEMRQAAVVLVRPDPAPELVVTLAEGGDAIVLFGGQPGVFYTLTGVGESPSPEYPAYFHQRADEDAVNKGIDQLRVERDLAITRAPSTTPLDPELALIGVEPGDRWTVEARKAMTDLEAAVTDELILE